MGRVAETMCLLGSVGADFPYCGMERRCARTGDESMRCGEVVVYGSAAHVG